MIWLFAIAAAFAAAALGTLAQRRSDDRRDRTVWRALIDAAGPADGYFDPAAVKTLPEAAQRYFLYMIAPGAPLVRGAEIEMTGELGLGDKDAPNYTPMTAQQILAPPYGLVWRSRAGAVSGSDGAAPGQSWTRFRLLGFIPIVRTGNDDDHQRSAFGRLVAEAAFWAPASLLPSERVRWTAAGPDTARAVVAYGGFEQAVDITVAKNGQPTKVLIQRWSNANPDKVYRLQPFGGCLHDFQDFNGYRLPMRVEGGNHFGTDAYFPFYKANITRIRLIGASAASL